MMFSGSGEMVRDMLFVVMFGGLFYSLRMTFFLAHAGEGLKVSVGMVGIVETSF